MTPEQFDERMDRFFAAMEVLQLRIDSITVNVDKLSQAQLRTEKQLDRFIEESDKRGKALDERMRETDEKLRKLMDLWGSQRNGHPPEDVGREDI